MFKKGLAFILVLALILAVPALSFASVGISINNKVVGQARDLNFNQPGAIARDGGKFTIPIVDSSLAAAGIGNGGSTSMTSTDLAVPVTYATVKKAIANDPAFTAGTLADGKEGQMLAFEITEQLGSEVFVITPATSTYFQTLSFNAVGDKVLLWFVDDTNGWKNVSETSVTVVLP